MPDSMGDIITLDNFASKMSTLTAEDSSLFALVDMGSNGIRFSISDLAPPASRLLKCVYRERAGISLYSALHESTPDAEAFHFSPKTIKQVSETLQRFRGVCDQYGVPLHQISVFATEAMRTAKNRDEMLSAIKAQSGLTVDILSPEMESLFGAMGARSGFDKVHGLFMDLGGGSVQMTYVNSSISGYDVLAAKAAKSMPFGAAKLTAALQSQDAESTINELQTSMKQTFLSMQEQFPELKKQSQTGGVTIYFCGGGFRGYGSMMMHTHRVQPYPISSIGGFQATGSQFGRYEDMLKVNDSEGKIFGMSKRRRQQFPAIAAVVKALVEAIPKIEDVVFCSGGNREGVLFMKLPTAIRERDPLRFLSALPNGSDSQNVIYQIAALIILAIPPEYCELFSSSVLEYIIRNTWTDLGNADDANSAKALHYFVSGTSSVPPSFTHSTCAMLSLTMCARWGIDLGPSDKTLYRALQKITGSPITAFLCEFVGALMRMLATLFPTFPKGVETLRDSIRFSMTCSSLFGKKDKKFGIRVRLSLAPALKQGLDLDDLISGFTNVGKHLDGCPLRCEVQIV